MKPFVPATVIAVDTTSKAYLAARAINRTLEQITPASIRLLTHKYVPRATIIPELDGLAGYSNFCIKEMAKHVDSPFALVVQSDGYVVNGKSWSNDFLKYDWIGAPWNPSGIIGNGGFSWRSKRLLNYMASANWTDCHPEDSAISIRHRRELEESGFVFAPLEVAARFAIEGRSWNTQEWQGVPNNWKGQFGFHSWLTPKIPDSPKIFHHSGDAGDVIYSLSVIKALGGGVLFLSPHSKYPYPLPSRWSRTGGHADWVDNLRPLIEAQPYVWSCKYTHGTPFSTTHDLNRFREPWKNRTARDTDTILKLHCDAFGVPQPKDAWLNVDNPIKVPNRPIVISRTQRYQDQSFKWHELAQKHHSKMVFVGTEMESELFQGLAAPNQIPHYKTKDALELARVISGAQLFIGNQSLPLAIAHGLHKNVVVETWKLNKNCCINRPGALYYLPDEVLK